MRIVALESSGTERDIYFQPSENTVTALIEYKRKALTGDARRFYSDWYISRVVYFDEKGREIRRFDITDYSMEDLNILAATLLEK